MIAADDLGFTAVAVEFNLLANVTSFTRGLKLLYICKDLTLELE